MANVIDSFSYPLDKQNVLEEFNNLAEKEGISKSKLLFSLLETYVKEHKDGNPQFTIDQFADPDFLACPAFYRDNRTWNHFLSKQNPQELENFKTHLIMIDKIMARYL